MNTIWNNNEIQFPRLISEILMCVAIRESDMEAMQDSMDLSREEINSLFDRAQDVHFDNLKKLTP